MEARLARGWHEVPVWVGAGPPGTAQIVLTANPDGSTWSILSLGPDGVACLALAGLVWAAIEPPFPEKGPDMMIGTKSPLQSLGAVAAFAGAASLIGWTLSPDDAAELGRQADQIAEGVSSLITLAADIASTFGGFVALVGRLRADRRIVLPWDRPMASGGE